MLIPYIGQRVKLVRKYQDIPGKYGNFGIFDPQWEIGKTGTIRLIDLMGNEPTIILLQEPFGLSHSLFWPICCFEPDMILEDVTTTTSTGHEHTSTTVPEPAEVEDDTSLIAQRRALRRLLHGGS